MESATKELDLIVSIASQKMLRIERWRDEWKHWRVGIEWYGEDEYEFICEYPTLLECLEKCAWYLKQEREKETFKKLRVIEI